ncbi:UvrABC system protein B [Prochlorococcus marinus str. MIT 1313]|nr:UvrABC system protein B [Prochlorococcus marinus str. MIT 1313]
MKVDVLQSGQVYEGRLFGIELFGDEVQVIGNVEPIKGEILQNLELIKIYSQKYLVASKDRLSAAVHAIRDELRKCSMLLLVILSCWRLRVRSQAKLMTGTCAGRFAIAMMSRTVRVTLLVFKMEHPLNI